VDLSFHKTHAGSTAVREALDRYRPDLVVCGHIHEARGMATHNGSTIINCGPAWMGYYAEVDWGGALMAELRQLT
jgi:Icc-related predicted phosphoesterase